MRPTKQECDDFIAQYQFPRDTLIEQTEITNEGKFEFYIFTAYLYNDETQVEEPHIFVFWPHDNKKAAPSIEENAAIPESRQKWFNRNGGMSNVYGSLEESE